MDSEKTLTAVEKELEQLGVVLREEIIARKKATKTSRLVTLALTGVVLFFVGLNVVHFSSAWSEDKFKQSLEKEMPELTPVAMRELNTMSQELLPVYAEEGKRQLQSFVPDLKEAVERELDLMGTKIVNDVHEDIHTSLNIVYGKIGEQLYEKFPELRDPKGQKEFQERFRAATEEAVLASVVEFETLFRKDVEELTDTVSKFTIEDENLSVPELRKKFLRLWLRLLDYEVMEL